MTLGAEGQGTVAGDAVNTAARVQSKVRPGTVWVDAQTRALTRGAIDFTDAGSRELKGKAVGQGRRAEAEPHLAAARQTFVELGANAWLRDIDGMPSLSVAG